MEHEDQEPNRNDLVHQFLGAKAHKISRVPGLGLTHIGQEIERWAENALIQVAAGDIFSWDISLVTIPNPQSNGSFGIATAYAFTLYLANPVLKSQPFGIAKIMADNPSKDQVYGVVHAAVEELRSFRSAALRMP